MEGALELIRKKYDVKSVQETGTGADVCCGRVTDRLDHFMCGDEDCRCYEAEGWCEDQWEEECVRPVTQAFKRWVSENKHLLGNEVEMTCNVSEKGYLYIYVEATHKAKRAKE